MKKKITSFDKYMTAATFAEANLADAAREYLQLKAGPKENANSKSRKNAVGARKIEHKALHAKY